MPGLRPPRELYVRLLRAFPLRGETRQQDLTRRAASGELRRLVPIALRGLKRDGMAIERKRSRRANDPGRGNRVAFTMWALTESGRMARGESDGR